MKIILIEDVENLGNAGEVVEVRGGYGRNYLIPRGVAIPATEENLANWEEQKAIREEEEAQRKASAEEVKAELEATTIVLEAKSGEDGKLFGSITNQDIAQALKDEHDINIERKKIVMDGNIRQIGLSTVEVRLYPEVVAELKVEVESR